MPLFARFLLAAWSLLALPLYAQKEPEKESKTDKGRHVRFLPIGDIPPFRQEIRDGVAYELPPPPGSVPPAKVILGVDDDSRQEADLQLGQITEPLKVPAGAGPLTIRRKGEKEDSVPWLKLDRPEEGDFLVVLWRDPVERTWNVTRSVVIAEDPESAPGGTARFINLSPVTVGVVFGGENLALLAGKSFRRNLPLGVDTPFQVGAADGKGGLKRYYSGSFFQNPNERSLAIIYKADGVDPRLPLKTFVMRESVTPPPKPKK